jgi:hypothetical protein
LKRLPTTAWPEEVRDDVAVGEVLGTDVAVDGEEALGRSGSSSGMCPMQKGTGKLLLFSTVASVD